MQDKVDQEIIFDLVKLAQVIVWETVLENVMVSVRENDKRILLRK